MLGSEETSGLDASSQRVRWGRICGTAASLTLKNIMYLINTDVYLDFCKCIFTTASASDESWTVCRQDVPSEATSQAIPM